MSNLKNDNKLTLGLSMSQSDSERALSTAGLSIDYPTIDRDSANLVQYTTVFATLLSNYRLAALQAVSDDWPGPVEPYVSTLQLFIADIAGVIDQISAAIAAEAAKAPKV